MQASYDLLTDGCLKLVQLYERASRNVHMWAAKIFLGVGRFHPLVDRVCRMMDRACRDESLEV